MTERKIHPGGAIRLLQEILLVHTESSAKQLHGTWWLTWYNPEKVLEPDTILQDPQKTQLLVATVEQVVERLKPQLADRLSMRLGLYDDQVHTLDEIGREFSVSKQAIRETTSKALRILRHPRNSRPLEQFIPDNLLYSYH